MSYLSLYRRLRPLSFAEITGQDHVTRTLSHALSSGQLAHAYLFCGPRGTGKTTTAKILARAVNCHLYPAPEPCGECPPCRNIAAGVSLDVIEMDAASNRGIDEIRELREQTRYASGESRYKVYIIDEAHMLTHEACNAFLKTLEEPPPGVVFILATTDPSRLPSTIVSRCQRFDFHLLTVEQIGDKLRQVVADEGWQAEDEAVRLIARLAEGSLRDALGVLEQCSTYGEETLSAEHVRSLTGVTRVETIGALIEALASGDLEGGLQTLQEIVYSGRDLTMLLRDLTFFISRLLLGGTPGRLQLEESYYGFESLLKRYRGRFDRLRLLELIELLHGLAGEMRFAHYPQFILEVAFIRMMRVIHGSVAPAQVEEAPAPLRVEKEKGSRAGEPAAAKPPSPPPSGQAQAAAPPTPERRAIPDPQPPPAADDAADDGAWWERLLKAVQVQNRVTFLILNSTLEQRLEKNLLTLAYQSGDYAGERIQEGKHRRLVETCSKKVLGRPLQIRVRYIEAAPCGGGSEDEPIPPPAHSSRKEKVARREPEAEKAYRFEDAVNLFPGEVFEVKEES